MLAARLGLCMRHQRSCTSHLALEWGDLRRHGYFRKTREAGTRVLSQLTFAPNCGPVRSGHTLRRCGLLGSSRVAFDRGEKAARIRRGRARKESRTSQGYQRLGLFMMNRSRHFPGFCGTTSHKTRAARSRDGLGVPQPISRQIRRTRAVGAPAPRNFCRCK